MRVTSIILLTALAGCSSMQDGESQQTITRTIVHLMEGRDPVVTTDVITVEEQQREVAERMARLTGTPSADRPSAGGIGEAQQGITHDTGCGSSSIALYDQTNFTGHEICFFGRGWADLTLYQHSCISYPIHVCAPWSENVRSWSAPYELGYFQDHDQYSTQYAWSFTPWFELSANTIVASAWYLFLSN